MALFVLHARLLFRRKPDFCLKLLKRESWHYLALLTNKFCRSSLFESNVTQVYSSFFSLCHPVILCENGRSLFVICTHETRFFRSFLALSQDRVEGRKNSETFLRKNCKLLTECENSSLFDASSEGNNNFKSSKQKTKFILKNELTWFY